MPSHLYSTPGALFDLVSYARQGPGQRDRLSPAEIQQVARTVGRTSEVMVKVLPKSANTLAAVQKHLDYIGRKGELDLETDEGEQLRGAPPGRDLAEDWDLELDADRSKSELTSTQARQAPRLVHKVIFSMPAGTPPDKVVTAVREFCREEFALKHRYALALHTDEPHPHVHVVIKAMSEEGRRLNIRKVTLGAWREGFARHLRDLGVPANATSRHVRGVAGLRKPDAIYRPMMRGESTHMRERADAVAAELAGGGLRVEAGRTRVAQTRKEVQRAWWALSEILVRQNQSPLAAQILRFCECMTPAATDKEWIASRLLERVRAPHAREGPSR